MHAALRKILRACVRVLVTASQGRWHPGIRDASQPTSATRSNGQLKLATPVPIGDSTNGQGINSAPYALSVTYPIRPLCGGSSLNDCFPQ
ncbi:hypothetical protein BV20DRAFT_971357 [Pilatotrama ljubarskyi]|nr:hypothetical protein BV20DRAFT_971357 [Pilatotrama ljubarskyi]